MRFDNALNWGNILTLLVLGIGGLIALAELRSEVRYVQEAATRLSVEQDSFEIRIRSLELGFGRIEERLVAIQNNLQQLINQKGSPE